MSKKALVAILLAADADDVVPEYVPVTDDETMATSVPSPMLHAVGAATAAWATKMSPTTSLKITFFPPIVRHF
jgi:hypothetical protein